MDTEAIRLFVGVDWATTEHQVCVVDQQGAVIEERIIAQSGTGLREFVVWLSRLCEGDKDRLAVSIEVPHGALVETLLDHAFAVHSINPKQLDRFRDRHFPAGAKDDRRDAYVLATSLRTDGRCFRLVRPDDPVIIRLWDLSRHDDELRESLHRHGCQLREQLQRYYPQLLELSASADERWIWALLELAPTPAKAQKLTRSRITKLLSEHRIRRLSAEAVCTVLQQPGFQLVPGTVEAASERVLLLLPLLRLIERQRHDIAVKVESMLAELAASSVSDSDPYQHRDVELILSLPGVGRVVAATMLAEASQALAERDYHALRAYAGIAPVTRQSGKKATVLMRQGCNGRLRNAIYHWSRVNVQLDPRSRQQYQRLKQAGHTHGRALRGVADRLLALLIAMLRDGTLYEPSRRVPRGPELAISGHQV